MKILGRSTKITLVVMLVLSCAHCFHTIGNVLEKGSNITEQMVKGIKDSIKETAAKCAPTDRSCFSQIVGMKIEALYGKSWNIHLFEKSTTMIKGRHYSHDRWISLVNEGEPAYSYFIFKPNDCSKPLIANTPTWPLPSDQKQYWGSSMTESLKARIRSLIDDAYSSSESMDANAEYLQNKMGPGRWEVVIWNTPSFDYLNSCMYASYFGLVIGLERGNEIWSYYMGRMSLI